MGFPIVSEETCQSIIREFKLDKNYLNRLLDRMQIENPELGDFIVSTANKFANHTAEKFDLPEEVANYIRGNSCWQMVAVYNAILQQDTINELEEQSNLPEYAGE